MASFEGKEYPIYRGSDGHVVAAPGKIPSLGPNDILIRITHSGVCHSDLAFYKAGAPLALGHEGVGIVEAVGSAVTSLKVGDRAGGGFHRNSCGHCKYCLTGRDILCSERTIFGEGDYDNGTYSPWFVGKEGYTYKIPDGLASEHAAPLQCAGATVYSAVLDNVKPRDRVGIVGIGGLGHLAIQVAAKIGAEVVVFSTSPSKEAEARAFGAAEFVLVGEPEKVSAPVDSLIIAGAHYPDWSKFLKKEIVARDATIVPLAAPVHGPLTLPADKFFWDVYHVRSSLVASKAQHADMLEFAARNGVKPLVQTYKLQGPETIEIIFKNMDENKIRYRAVVEY